MNILKANQMIRPLSLLLLSIGIILTLASPSMFLVFVINLIVLTLNIVLFLMQRPHFLRLSIMWQLSYLYIIIAEGLIYHSEIISLVGEIHALTASKYMNTSNLATLLFYSIFYNEQRNQKNMYEKKTIINSNNFLPLLLIISLQVFFFYMYGGISLSQIQTGMTSKFLYHDMMTDSTFNKVKLQIAVTVGVLLPALITYYLKYIIKSKTVFLWAFTLSMPTLIIIITMNSRHRLFFAILGLFLVYYNQKRLNIKFISRLMLLAIFLITISVVAIMIRRYGIEGLQINDKTAIERVFNDNQYITNNARLVDYFQYNSHFMGKSIFSWFVLWIPRKVWPDKPKRSGHWFIREYLGNSIRSDIHSVSFTFSGDPYIDFGFTGGIIFCSFFFGVILVCTEKWTARYINSSGHPNILICSMAYSWAFFCIKSFVTSTLLFLGTIFFVLLFRFTLQLRHIDVLQE